MFAQRVQLLVPPRPVSVGNAFQVQYVILDAGDLVSTSIPSFNDFKIASGPNRYKGNMVINGRAQPVENLTYTLVPLKAGKLHIPSITASFRNASEESSGDKSIDAVPPAKASFNTQSSYTDVSLYAPANRLDIPKLMKENLFIHVKVDRRSCFVGEPVMASFVLYSRLQSTSEVLNAPSLYGFSVMDLLDIHESHLSIETINGKVFNTSVLRKVLLYPEQPGNLVIDGMELHNTVEFEDSINREKLSFENKLVSEPVTIQVKPLPEKKPADHTGAVGRFSIKAAVATAETQAGRQGELLLTIAGQGNFIQFSPPLINWPKGLDVFEPQISDSLSRTGSPVTGSRQYRFGFAADSAGDYILPPVSFSFFDTDSGKFRTVHTDAVRIRITAATATSRDLKKTETSRDTRFPWMILLIVLPLLTLGAWLLLRRRSSGAAASPAPLPPKPSELLNVLDFSQLSDKQACLEIQKSLAPLKAKYLQLSPAQKQEWASIESQCQLLIYSTINAEGRKEELKARAVKLMEEVEGISDF